MLWADMLANFISVMLLTLLLLKLLKEASCLEADIWTDWDETLPCKLVSPLVLNTTSLGGSSTRAVEHSRYTVNINDIWLIGDIWHWLTEIKNLNTQRNVTQTICCGSISKYIHTYICQELAQCLQETNPYISIITLHAGARITRRKMISHIEHNVYSVHSGNKCNRAVGSFAFES